MKKILFFTAMLIGITACSDDDSRAKTSREPLVSKITVKREMEPIQVYGFIYDDQNRITEILIDGSSAYKYYYNEQNYLEKVLRYGKAYAVFHYNVDNIVSAYEFGDSGHLSPVTYNAATNTYRFPPQEFKLEENDDVSTRYRQKIIFSNQKGAFANIGGKNVQLMHYFVGMLSYTSSKMAIAEILDDNDVKLYQFENQYSEAGYPIKINVDDLNGSDTVITLEY